MAGLLQRAWDWLVPPEVPVVDGRLVQRTRRAAPMPPVPPVPPAAAALPPAPARSGAWVHPRASHQVRLCGVEVHYLLEHGRRRSVGMLVGLDGLRVRAPRGLGLAAVEGVLQQKADWIVRKLAEQQRRGEQVHSARIQWGAPVQLPYLGRVLTVALAEPGMPGGPRRRVSAILADGQDVLHLGLGLEAGVAPVRQAVHAWWLLAARQHFTARLNHFAPQLGVQWRSLRLSSARTRWGSARSDGSIRLNWRLLHFAPELIDYVVVHELSHLRYMDHSPRFWATVATVLPDYRALRQRLRDQVAPRWHEDDA